MKKLGIGCAILAGILVLAIGLGSCFLIHKARSFVSGYSKLAEIPALNAGIRNQAAFAPPRHARLPAAQVEVLPGGDHMTAFGDPLFLAKLRAFLAAAPAASTQE